MPDVSIIICTYNPDYRILERCLKAIANLKRDNLEVECFLVDNNSPSPVSDSEIVKTFLQQCPWATLLVEKKQGLTHARICGCKNSTAPIIVFFDDDNEPDEGYLQGIKDYAGRFPQVGIFGPGDVNVDFVEGAERWLSKYRYIFQEFHQADEKFDTTTEGFPSCYPAGTGMVVRREILEAYSKRVLEGNILTLGRTGKALTSSEDLQIVWLGITMGYGAGRTPLLSINHMINAKKANFPYLKRLSYGGGLSYLPARYEIFPEERKNVNNTASEVRKSMLRICKVFVFNFYKPKFLIISIAGQVGILDSIYAINNKKPSRIINWLKRTLKLE